MNILMITELYPAYKGHSIEEISYALHNFVKIWDKTERAIVIRPFYTPSKTKNMKFSINYINGVEVINFPVARIPKTKIFFYGKLLKFLKEKNFKPDVIIGHLFFNIFHGVYISKKLGVPFIAGIHNTDIFEMVKDKKRYEDVFSYSSGIACRSNSVYNKLKNVFPQFEDKCFIINSGIEKDFIENKEFFIEKIENWKNSKKINFVTVALLQELKNIDINLRVFSKLENVDWTYTIVGDGEERGKLQKLTDELKIRDRVKFEGMKTRSEALEYLKKSDIFFMISAPETFGLAYLEAMAKGNIVIGAYGWGIDGIIKNGENGFLCKPGDEGNLKKTLNDIIFNLKKEELEKILEKSYETICRFTEEDMAEAYLNEIKKVVKK